MSDNNFEVVTTSIEDYIKIIFEIQNKIPQLNPLGEVLLFRGQSNSKFKLLPSLARTEKVLENERNLIEMAKYKLPSLFSSHLLPINLLALLQHHGIPTRLLDVTSNPLVALYFACLLDGDGEVIVFKNAQYDVANYSITHAIAESYKFIRGQPNVIDFYKNVENQDYFLEQRQTISYMPDKGKVSWVKSLCEKPIFIHAEEQSMRQMLQQGQFILFPNKIKPMEAKDVFSNKIEQVEPEYVFSNKIEAIPKDKEHLEKIIIINQKDKRRILKELKILGICEGTLFADDKDRVCKQIVNDIKNN